MRTLTLTLLASILALPAAAQRRMEHDPDKAVKNGGVLPEGWSARVDRGRPLDNVNFRKMGNGWHVTLGPALVLYRSTDRASDNYTVRASYTQTKAPRHPEGYGLIVGGSDLAGPNQQYTYFLVRGDGKFLVKRRTGNETSLVSSGWTANDAIHPQDANGKCTNEVAITVADGKAKFSINGVEVFQADASALDVDGTYGLRVNHNLDVHIGKFALEK
ncbi:MAG: hypothetical protein ACE5HT_12865 [Gemmatimonadales bacterium]